MSPDVLSIAGFTALMAASATVVALPPGVALGWILARRVFPARSLVETLVSLPLVLPPVATGLLLLWFFGRRSVVGRALDRAGIEIVFTWKAVVIAMAVMSLPIIVLTARAGFEQLNPRFEQMAASLGARPLRIFFTITLPLAGRSVIAAALLGFARSLGEFGATIIVAGGIPGATQTLSTAIFNFAELGRDRDAMQFIFVAATLAFAAMLASNLLVRRRHA